MRPSLVTTLAALSILPGCFSGGDDAPASNLDGTAPQGPPQIQLPEWSVGDWWTYATGSGEDTSVVTADLGADWVVDTTNPELAFFDARTDISSLGPRRKADLAGSQGDTRVAYYRWPLVAGESWTTTWDDVQRTITVLEVADGVARLEAREGSTVRAAYTFDAEARNTGQIRWFADNGTERFSMRLLRNGHDFNGEVVRWHLTELLERNETFTGPPATWNGQFTVPEGTTDLWISARVACPEGSIAFGVAPEDSAFGIVGNEGWGFNEVCPFELVASEVAEEEPRPGAWSYGMLANSPQAEGTYALTLLMRTLERIPVR